MKGIAHVSFAGGGLFVPARSPYDWQMLVEHVAERARSKGEVQVLVDDERWMVHLDRRAPVNCGACGFAARLGCRPAADAAATYCVKCAFGERMALPTGDPEAQGNGDPDANRE